MRIAVTYENGEIFQHFGHTRQFKVYDVKEDKILSEEERRILYRALGEIDRILSKLCDEWDAN